MASINWQKQTMQKAGAMKRHHGQKERLNNNHSNKDIDKSLTSQNYYIGCSDYSDAYEKMRERVAAVDKKYPPERVTKDRKVCCSLEAPCPAEISAKGEGEERRFFEELHKLYLEFFGQENVHGTCVHKDEVHKYTDSKTKEERESLSHGHSLVSCYAEWTQVKKNGESKVGWSELPTAMDVAGWAARNTRSAAASTAISILLDLHSLRSEETRGLKYRDVFEQNGKCYIYVWQTKTCINNVDIHKPSTKTEASTRKILIDRRLYDMIHAQPHKSDDEFIIKETYPTYCNHIKAVMKDNGHPELTPHKLRHIFKSDNKRDNVVAIAVGGWCSGTNADGGDRSENGVSETVYTHVRQCEMDELMEKYSKELLDAYDGTAASAVRIIVSRMVG